MQVGAVDQVIALTESIHQRAAAIREHQQSPIGMVTNELVFRRECELVENVSQAEMPQTEGGGRTQRKTGPDLHEFRRLLIHPHREARALQP